MTKGFEIDPSSENTLQKSSRKDRRKKQKTSFAAAPLIGSVAVGSLLVGVLAGFLLFKTPSTELEPVSWETGNVGFATVPNLGEGWIDASKTLSDAEDSKGSERNPLDIFKGTCSVTRTTAYLPASSAGRGDDFLTKDALFTFLDSRKLPTSFSKTKIIADERKIDAYQNVNESVGVAVRAFDKVQVVPEDIKTAKPSTGTTSTKEGLPLVTIVYSCGNKDEFSEDTWKQVLETSEIGLTF